MIEAWCQPEVEFISQEEVPHSCDTLSHHHEGDAGVKIKAWPGHTLTKVVFDLKLTTGLNMDLKGSLDFFTRSSSQCGHGEWIFVCLSVFPFE